MTVFDVAKKNIIGNARNYAVYFISMFFSVVSYYTFVSLQYSADVARSIESSQGVQSVFMVASVVLVFFVAVFTSYSNNFFTRRRKKEVGLYALLGMRKRTIAHMLLYEQLIMGAGVLVTGIATGTFLSRLFTMIFIRLLGTPGHVGITFSIQAIVNTVIVFIAIIFFTSVQSYRLIYKFQLIELFRAEQEGEHEPRAFGGSAILAVVCLVVGYWFAFQSFSNNADILINLGVMVSGIIVGTALLFSSLVIVLLKTAKRHKRSYYSGMNLVSISNLVYRIKGQARTLCVISLLSALALSAANVGIGLYYGFAETARLTAPFSYMFVAQDAAFNAAVDRIIRADEAHPVSAFLTLPVVRSNGTSSSPDLLPERYRRADDTPVKVMAVSTYNQATQALRLPALAPVAAGEAIAIRPLYTDLKLADVVGETITLEIAEEDLTLSFAGMTVERVLNWSYPDVTIVVSDSVFQALATQVSPVEYVGYVVQQHHTTGTTANELAAIQTPQSQLSSFYAVYRQGIEDAAVNVFILGFLALVFVMATGSVIYFKQVTEATADKTRYDILRKIGASNREISGSILQQNAFVFVLPFVVGLAHYLVILGMVRRLFSGITSVNLTLPVLVSVVSFTLIYIVYYLITVNTISKIVLGVSAPVIRIAAWVGTGGVLAALGMVVWSAAAVPQEVPAGAAPIPLDLPPPTGTYVVGTTELHVIDDERVDPWVPNTKRELMISIWYPAQQESAQQAFYMPPVAAAYYDQHILSTIGIDPGRVNLSEIGTNAWVDAPVAPSENGWPVLLYSPGGSVPRVFGTVLVEDLASRGYVVITMDHTYETSVVEFPNGRIETQQLPNGNAAETVLKMVTVRVQDMQFVLDQLALLQAGGNLNAAQRVLPAGLGQALDLSQIGIFGHSAGGATAAQAMFEDARIRAGIDMDGTLGYLPDHLLPVVHDGLDRPFMLMHAGYNSEGEQDSHLTADDRSTFWHNSSGWKRDLSIPAGNHYTFTDYQFLLPLLESRVSIAPAVTQNLIGTADPEQMLAAQRTYIGAFFDLHLKGIPQPVLDAPSPRFGEVEFVQ